MVLGLGRLFGRGNEVSSGGDVSVDDFHDDGKIHLTVVSKKLLMLLNGTKSTTK